MFAFHHDQTVPSNMSIACLFICLFVFFLYIYFAPPKRLNNACNLCLFGYLFCSSLRLNSQSSRDKVPAPRLAPQVSWNNLAWHVLLGAHPLNPVLTHLFIEPSPHPLPKPVTTSPLGSSRLLASGFGVYANSLHSAHPSVTWTRVWQGFCSSSFGDFLKFCHPLWAIMFLKFDISKFDIRTAQHLGHSVRTEQRKNSG